jgi:tetratricopeptide (TPR) repeat protein
VRTLDILAGVQREMGNLALALLIAREAVRLAHLYKQRDLLPHAWNTLGNIHYDLHEDAAAAPCYRKALREFRRSLEPVGLAVALSNHGNCLVRLGLRKEGLARLHEALELARRQDYKRLVADVLSYLTRIHAQSGDHDAARRLAFESNQLARHGDYFDTLFVNHFYLWRMAGAEGDAFEEKICLKSLKYFRTKLESSFPELEEFDRLMRSHPPETAASSPGGLRAAGAQARRARGITAGTRRSEIR